MMSLMSKLLKSTLIASLALSATLSADDMDGVKLFQTKQSTKKREKKLQVPPTKQLVKYIKRAIVKNPEVRVNGVTVLEATTHKELKGWTVLLTTMDLTFKKKEIHAPEMMFVKDGLITNNLVNLKTGREYRNEIKPSVPKSMYNDAHLLFGNKDAAHKVLIFSDPECPFCRETVPDIFKAAKAHPETLAVYYYHLPLLRIHPVSDVLTKIMHIAQEEGRLDIVEKMYTLKISPREKNVAKILKAVKKQTGYSVTKKQVEAKSVQEAIDEDVKMSGKMMVAGTPTIYIDGKWDKMRNGYKKFIKQK